MENIFLKVFNLSITASYIIIAVAILRILLKKTPKWINCLLWGIVALRLSIPFSIESIFSLIPSAEPIPQNIVTAQTPAIDSGFSAVNNAINPVISNALTPNASDSANPMQIVIFIASVLWALGVAAMIIYGIVSYVRLRVKVAPSILYKDNIYYCDNITSPFILGIIKPKIFLPSGINQNDIDYVIAHEKAHLKRLDHLIKPFGFLLLSVYWFNPLIWVAYILLCRDIEMACDQKVIKDMDSTNKKGYLEALVSSSVHRRMIMACPLAFGEVGVKDRIKSVLNYKKPAFWVIIVAVIACIAIAVGFLTNPKTEKSIKNGNLKNDSIINDETVADKNQNPYFNATVLEVYENSVLVEPFSNEEIRKSSDKIYVGTDVISTNPVPELKKGMQIRVVYNGKILETYPASIPDVFAIYELDTNGQVIFPSGDQVKYIYDPVEICYSNGMYSYVADVEGLPTYQIINNMELYEMHFNGPLNLHGEMTKIKLSKEKFDLRFSTDMWDKASSIRQNNKNAWEIYSSFKAGDTPLLYLLLEQNDGTFYLAQGYYNIGSNNPTTSDDSQIRFVYKLKAVDSLLEANPKW